ncbi:MAG: TIGR03790 family protein [Terrimicrobiaceae bacterium]|nr:TIGR03790 family protein [Terrimicrobiaceae bacterium]
MGPVRRMGALVIFGLAGLLPIQAGSRDSSATLVLYNTNDPDSKGLAQYYAGRRNIPSAQVVGLDCPVMEEILRGDYESTIAAPLRKLFRARKWWKMEKNPEGSTVVTSSTIRYVAIMRGMPLKIAPDPSVPPSQLIRGLPAEVASRNDGSVDGELTTLGMPLPGPAGIFPNPYYRRFTPILEDPVYPGLLLPARLDGPTPSLVRAMIDDSLDAEREGLHGWSYVDGRGIASGGYAEGDQWMGNLAVSMRAQGLPVIFDNSPATFPAGFPVTDAAVYFGWYAGSVDGPFAEKTFHFRPGAIAVHLHSFSAATLLSATANWCGPLLARGAAATLGNVYEPYLSLTANLDVFQDRLMAGFTLAESGWMSQRALSWMGVIVGDPLYRPYATWRHVDASTTPGVWQRYRNIVLKASGNILQAADALQQAGEQTGNSFFFEALGAARMDAKDWSGAIASFDEARKLAADPAVRIRLELETIVSLQALGKKTEATALALAASSGLPPGPGRELFSQFVIGPLPAPSVGPIALSGPVPEDSPSAPLPSATPADMPTPVPTPPPPPPIPEMRP